MAPQSAGEPDFEVLVSAAAKHCKDSRWQLAATALQAALVLRRGDVGVLHSLGVVAASQRQFAIAVDYFDRVLHREPRYAAAHFNLGLTLQQMGHSAAAIQALARAVQLEPDFYAAHKALALCLLAAGSRDRALDHLAHLYELRRGEIRTGIAKRSHLFANRCKLRHDAQQLHYLAHTSRDGAPFTALSARYASIASAFPESVSALTPADLEVLGDTYNTGWHLAEAPELAADSIALPAARDRLVAEFRATGAAVADDLLTPAAFAAFRRYLLESTIWHDFSHIDGLVGSYLEDGLACPILLQIVTDLRAALPEILADLPLTQAWAFKIVEAGARIAAHADDAQVSVNFWMTSDNANRVPGRGGMKVCRAPPPADWKPQDYRADQERAILFLEQHRKDLLQVPYRANRAVLFQSRLLHCSDSPVFAENYENHRINVTLLFGHGGAETACTTT
jgi:hypothetical protein